MKHFIANQSGIESKSMTTEQKQGYWCHLVLNAHILNIDAEKIELLFKIQKFYIKLLTEK